MLIVYLNGRFVPESEAALSPLDRGFLFGDAIYEVVRFDRGRPYRLTEHLARMKEGLDAIRIQATPEFFAAAADRLLSTTASVTKMPSSTRRVSRGAARATTRFRRKVRTPTVFAFTRETGSAAASRGRKGDPRNRRALGRCDIKSVNLLPNVPRRAEGQGGPGDGCHPRSRRLRARRQESESLHCDEGRPAHGTQRSADPAGRDTRRGDRSGARLGFTVEERAFRVEEMFSAQEVFFASTTL
jgi:D-alanine transaminase